MQVSRLLEMARSPFDAASVAAICKHLVEACPITSRPESLELRVQSLQLDAAVGGCELPVGFGVVLVAVVLPCGDFVGEDLLVSDAAIQILRRENATKYVWQPATGSNAIHLRGCGPRPRRDDNASHGGMHMLRSTIETVTAGSHCSCWGILA